MFALAPLLAVLLLGETPPVEASPAEVWAGHQILRGMRHVPLHSDVLDETENYVIVKVQRRGDHIELRQHFCRVESKPVKGVTVALSASGVAHMPATPVAVDVAADGGVKIGAWDVAWGREDLDGDGKPGATLTVSGTFCSGDVYVSSQSHYTVERAHLDGHGLSGELKVEQRQKILGASGLCLRAMAGDSSETQRGTFAYRPVPAGTTCQSLAGKPWPVQAQRKAGAAIPP
ncbi:MAG TPA: hypothetical protein VJ801_17410 [Polyangia bacterium]|jgi:hypothetical protein|nr:hypothetical protein [Polyangia bacterium]